MQVNVPLPIKYLGVDYAAGNQTIADGIALDLILLGLAMRVAPLPQSGAVNAIVDPLTGAVDLKASGRSIGAKIGAASVSYDSQNRVSTHDSWTISYDSSGRASSQTNGTLTQTFTYDSAGRYTGITES